MGFAKYLGSFIAVGLILCAGSFAKDINSGKFDLAQKARIGSTMLEPGHYKAEWAGPTNDLTVSILQKGKTMATTRASIKELPSRADEDSVTIDSVKQRVDEIDFSNRTEALVFSGSSCLCRLIEAEQEYPLSTVRRPLNVIASSCFAGFENAAKQTAGRKCGPPDGLKRLYLTTRFTILPGT